MCVASFGFHSAHEGASFTVTEALAFITTQDYPVDRYEILIVDNNSKDNTQEVVESFARAPCPPRYLFEGRQGSSHARNRALVEARGEIVVFTDDDVLGGSTWLRQLVEVFAMPGNEKVGVVGGETYPVFPDGLPAWAEGHYRPFGYRTDVGPLAFGQLPSTANVAIRKKVLDEVGGFRTDLGRLPNRLTAGEDHDLMRRIRSAGHGFWFHPGASLQHVVPGGRLTLKYISKYCRDSAYSRVIERRGFPGFWVWLPSRILVYTLLLPLSLAISGLCLLVLQPGYAKRWLTRFARAVGYLTGSFYVVRCLLAGRKPEVY